MYQIAPGPFHTLSLSKDGELYAFGSSTDGKLGIFRLSERMVGRGAGNDTGIYNIDYPYKLTEEVPPRFFKSQDDKDVFDGYKDF